MRAATEALLHELSSFDFTGESGKLYALISDQNIAVNAQFGEAYTTGLTVDPETMQTSSMRQQGTVRMQPLRHDPWRSITQV